MSTIESTKPGAFISLSQAAEMLSISVPTLPARIAAGELPTLPQRTTHHPDPSARPGEGAPARAKRSRLVTSIRLLRILAFSASFPPRRPLAISFMKLGCFFRQGRVHVANDAFASCVREQLYILNLSVAEAGCA